jgi:hypothetical protein
MPEEVPGLTPSQRSKELFQTEFEEMYKKAWGDKREQKYNRDIQEHAIRQGAGYYYNKAGQRVLTDPKDPKSEGRTDKISTERSAKEGEKRRMAMAPEEAASAWHILEKMAPTALQREQNLIQDYKGLIGGIGATASQSPASFLDISPLLSWYKANYGKDLLPGYSSPQRILTEKLPAMISDLGKAQSRHAGNMLDFWKSVTSDVATSGMQTGVGSQSAYSYGQGGGGRGAGSNLDYYRELDNQRKVSAAAQNIIKPEDIDMLEEINNIANILNRYEIDKTPGLEKYWRATPTIGSRVQYGPQGALDKENMDAALKKLTLTVNRALNGGHASNMDLKAAKDALATGLGSGEQSFRYNLARMREKILKHVEKREKYLPNLMRQEIKKQGWDVMQELEIIPFDTGATKTGEIKGPATTLPRETKTQKKEAQGGNMFDPKKFKRVLD